MSDATQVAFQIPNGELAEIDALVARREFRSRAEALRAAAAEFLARRREERIDARLAAGYAAVPEGPEVDGLAAASLRGLTAADLDW